MTLFANDQPTEKPTRDSRRKPATSLRAKTGQAQRTKAAAVKHAAADAVAAAGPITLSASAQQLHDEIATQWELSSPVRGILRLACEALTKAEQLEAITAAQGMCIADAKGASKPHPAALMARDYRAQCSNALQRLLAHLEK